MLSIQLRFAPFVIIAIILDETAGTIADTRKVRSHDRGSRVPPHRHVKFRLFAVPVEALLSNHVDLVLSIGATHTLNQFIFANVDRAKLLVARVRDACRTVLALWSQLVAQVDLDWLSFLNFDDRSLRVTNSFRSVSILPQDSLRFLSNDLKLGLELILDIFPTIVPHVLAYRLFCPARARCQQEIRVELNLFACNH